MKALLFFLLSLLALPLGASEFSDLIDFYKVTKPVDMPDRMYDRIREGIAGWLDTEQAEKLIVAGTFRPYYYSRVLIRYERSSPDSAEVEFLYDGNSKGRKEYVFRFGKIFCGLSDCDVELKSVEEKKPPLYII